METSKSELEDMSDSVTCARLILGHQKVLFVKSNWFTDHFSLVAFDGENSWSLQGTLLLFSCLVFDWSEKKRYAVF